MNRHIRLNEATAVFFAVLGLGCFCLSPLTQAVSPPPDGGYPGNNTAEGDGALLLLTSGRNNTADGFRALVANTTGSDNVASGAAALLLNTTGSENTANGFAALSQNMTGGNNTATGSSSLEFNTTGNNNTATGFKALFSNTTGDRNTAVGANALTSNTTGIFNTAEGVVALSSNTTGNFNTAIGAGALLANTADQNTAAGVGALLSNTTGSDNTAQGAFALLSNTTGMSNTAVGDATLFSNTTGNGDTAVGFNALTSNTTGFTNTAVGDSALQANTTGVSNTAIGAFALQASNSTFCVAVGVGALMASNFSENTAVGHLALSSNTTGGSNTAVGFQAGLNATTGDGNVYIGVGMEGVAAESNHTYIRNVNTTTVSGGGTDTVTVDLASGLLGHLSSSRRYKEDIKPMGKSSEALYRLKPVSYRYKKEIDSTQSPAFGFVAEEVAEVNRNLVACNSQGQPESVHYEMVNAMLLNEFLKEHKTVQEQGATIARLEKQIEALTAGLQKVSAQRGVSKASPQTVLNNQ